MACVRFGKHTVFAIDVSIIETFDKENKENEHYIQYFFHERQKK